MFKTMKLIAFYIVYIINNSAHVYSNVSATRLKAKNSSWRSGINYCGDGRPSQLYCRALVGGMRMASVNSEKNSVNSVKYNSMQRKNNTRMWANAIL